MSEERFSYVIGRPWEVHNPNNLCIYVFHNSEIQYGTDKDAENLLQYVKRQKIDDGDLYKIYRVTFDIFKQYIGGGRWTRERLINSLAPDGCS